MLLRLWRRSGKVKWFVESFFFCIIFFSRWNEMNLLKNKLSRIGFTKKESFAKWNSVSKKISPKLHRAFISKSFLPPIVGCASNWLSKVKWRQWKKVHRGRRRSKYFRNETHFPRCAHFGGAVINGNQRWNTLWATDTKEACETTCFSDWIYVA